MQISNTTVNNTELEQIYEYKKLLWQYLNPRTTNAVV